MQDMLVLCDSSQSRRAALEQAEGTGHEDQRYENEAPHQQAGRLWMDLPQAKQIFVDDLIDTVIPASRRMAGIKNEGATVELNASYGIESILSPALVVQARDDQIDPYVVGATIASLIGGAELKSLEKGGRLLLGNHAELQKEIGMFLGKNLGSHGLRPYNLHSCKL